MKQNFKWMAIFVFSFAFVMSGMTAELSNRKLHMSVGGGIGLPKIPFSQYRTPISFLLNASLPVKVMPSFWLQGTGGVLSTISLGSINSSDRDMRFNLAWAGFEGMYRIRYSFEGDAFITAGLGEYHLSQLFDEKEDILNTLGFSLALVNWNYGLKYKTVFSLRWHILFEPDDNPQVATVTMGFLL